MKRLRVTFVVDLDDVFDELPEPGDEDTDLTVCECLLEMLTSRALIYLDPDEDPVELSPVGWSVEAGGYGDMQIGTLRTDLPQAPSNARSSAPAASRRNGPPIAVEMVDGARPEGAGHDG